MSLSTGGGVSAGGGNVDIADILQGGDQFMARLKLFDERAAVARDNIAKAEALVAEAKLRQAAADETQARADAQLAANVAKAEELDIAIAAAKAKRAELDGRLEPFLKLTRSWSAETSAGA
jgi:DNA primase large subunit